jgi:hypothetical protein
MCGAAEHELQDEEKDDSFKVCFEDCSLHEQLRKIPLHFLDCLRLYCGKLTVS